MIQHVEKLDNNLIADNSATDPEHASSAIQADANEASTSGNEMQYPPDVKFGFDELCPVCGDKVSGYHYGLLTCESCKGFFKRTVQNKKVYSCVDNRSCHIDKSQRKRCPYCRFQKCLSVGMKLEAVRQDRMRGGRNKFGPMYKRDRALKQQAVRQQHHIMASCQMRLANGMTPLPPTGEDVKPDPAILQHMAANLASYVNSSPMSSMPSPSMPDSPPTDLSRVSGSSQPSPVTSSPQGPYPGSHMGQTYSSHPSMMSALPNNYSVAPQQQNPHHHPHHHGNHPHHPHHHHHHHQMSPMAAAQSTVVPIVPQMITDMKSNMTDENEIKQKLLSFVQNEFGHEDLGNQTKLLQMICKLSDQLLFLMVEWARTSVFFKELKVEDQMKLLQNSWSEILILDFVHRLVRDTWSGEIILANGQDVNLDSLDKLGLPDAKDRIKDLVRKMKELKIDSNEYMCLKYLILLNPDVPGLESRGHVEQCQESVNAALMEYCVNFYPNVKDKFGQVLLRLPEVRLISIRAEEFMYYKHMNGEIPEQTLLIEMLHSKKK